MNLTGEDYDAAQRQDRQDLRNLGLAQVLFNLEALFPFRFICHRDSNLVRRETPRLPRFHTTQNSP